MTDRQKKAAIRREPDGVYCQGCGKKIDLDSELSNSEYVKTKRGSNWFFHTACAGRVWKRKICWADEVKSQNHG